MVAILDEPDCGNAPRKTILRDFVVALAAGDSEQIASLLAEDFAWSLVGGDTLTTIDAVRKWVQQLAAVDEVAFGSLLTHGRGASVNGELCFADGQRTGFCHVLNFTGAAKTAKIRGVTSYVIPFAG